MPITTFGKKTWSLGETENLIALAPSGLSSEDIAWEKRKPINTCPACFRATDALRQKIIHRGSIHLTKP